MKKNLTKNIPLKIMSVIVGILVWLIVVNVDDPIITKGFVISDVQIINEAYVDQLGQMVMQDDSENTFLFCTATSISRSCLLLRPLESSPP